MEKCDDAYLGTGPTVSAKLVASPPHSLAIIQVSIAPLTITTTNTPSDDVLGCL